jgi:hypothetical protein
MMTVYGQRVFAVKSVALSAPHLGRVLCEKTAGQRSDGTGVLWEKVTAGASMLPDVPGYSSTCTVAFAMEEPTTEIGPMNSEGIHHMSPPDSARIGAQ